MSRHAGPDADTRGFGNTGRSLSGTSRRPAVELEVVGVELEGIEPSSDEC